LAFFSERNPLLIALYRVVAIGLCGWGATTDLGTAFAFADVTMGSLALVNLFALAMLFRRGLRLMRDFDEQIAAGVDEPVFDVTKFADLNIDPQAWKLEEEDAQRVAPSQLRTA
jgi:AGCS family alanine or glycine:cation symporter